LITLLKRVAEQTASISIIEWGRVTMAGVLEELDSKLSSTFQIKNKPMTNGDEVDKLELLSSLLRLYDESWAIEGTRVIFGHHQGKGTERSHQLKRSQEQRKLRGFLRLADLGHLAAEGESLVGARSFLG